MNQDIIFFLLFSILILVCCDFSILSEEMKKKINKNLNKIENKEIKIKIPKVDTNNPKLTVVVPVFNGAKYLRKALTSIQSQTLKELEIFLIDDGSTDDTYTMMKDFQKKDKRIKIKKNKENKGTLYSRLFAAQKSKANYITFLDVDDLYSDNEVLKNAYTSAKNNSLELLQFNLFIGNYTVLYGYKTEKVFTNKIKEKLNKIIYQPEIKNNFHYIKDAHNLITGIVFDKIYSKNLIQKMIDVIGNDFWKENLSFSEDFLMVFAAARVAKNFMFLDGQGGIWHWDGNRNGMTGGFEMIEDTFYYPEEVNKKLSDNLYINERIFDILENESDSEVMIFNLIFTMAIDEFRTKTIGKSSQTERYLDFLVRFYNWKYATDKNKEEIKKIAWNVVVFKNEASVALKYRIFYEDDLWKLGLKKKENEDL